MSKRRHKWLRLFKAALVVFVFSLSIFSAHPSFSITPIYVDPVSGADINSGDSWGSGHAKKTILNGVTSVDVGGTVYLANGRYIGTNNTNIIWPNRDNISLIAANTGLATIDGQSALNTRFAYVQNKLNITFEGITIQNCRRNDAHGGAIGTNANNMILTFRNILVKNCTAESNLVAGFIYAHGSSTTVYQTLEVIGSTFIGCRGFNGGALYGEYTKIDLTNCLFKWNSAYQAPVGGGNGGGAIQIAYGGRLNAINCTFESNSALYTGGALGGQYGAGNRLTLIANGCTFNNNTAQYGAIYYADAYVDNCLITKNTATIQSGFLHDGSVYAKNCLFAYNSAPTYALDSVATFIATNCAFSKNTNTTGPIINVSSLKALRYCAIQPGSYLAGTGNVTGECYFVSTRETDSTFMWPAPGSLAIDTGINETGITLQDRTGFGRPYGLAIDSGPFEFRGPSIHVLYPNGGEVTREAYHMSISWQASSETGYGSLNPVNLYFSSDNGAHWTSIATNQLPTGTFDYTVPSIPSNKCLISAEVQGNSGWNFDTSDGTFEIKSATVYVSTTGSDDAGDGTPTFPYKTILKGLTMVEPTGEVILKNGIYSGMGNVDLTWPNKNNLTLSAEHTGLATIDGQATSRFVSIVGSVNTTFEGLTVQNCRRTALNDHGGALLVYRASPLSNLRMRLIDMTFIRCSAEGTNAVGGVMYFSGTTITLEVSGSTFLGNKADRGGVIYSENNRLYFTDCVFKGNKATRADVAGGGAVVIWCDNATKALIYATDCTFEGNSSPYVGGALAGYYAAGARINILLSNCNFKGNIARYGGVTYYSSVTATGCAFTLNQGTEYSGVQHDGNMRANNCQFISNEAQYGGVVANSGDWNTTNCIFRDNKSDYLGGGGEYGGGVGMATNFFTENCTYERNIANYRGGVFERCPIVATNCAFSYNTAPNMSGENGYGGVVMNYDSYYSITMNNCIFLGNTSRKGGALGYGPMTLNNCVFQSNIGTVEGGALIQDTNTRPISATNCIFYDNRSAGKSVDYFGNFNAVNCIFWNNTSSLFNNTLTSRYSDFPPNAFAAGTGNISSEPKFISTNESGIPAGAYFRPKAGSPMIDAGIFEAGIANRDAAGLIRPFGLTADIGAYEFHGPSVKVTYPNGKEKLSPNTSVTILWTASNDATMYQANPFTVRYSSDEAKTWILIQSGIAYSSSGSCPWTTPIQGGDTFLISVEAAGTAPAPNNWNCDTSNEYFQVQQGYVYISPSGDDDTGTGTINKPYWTIAKGLDAVVPSGEVRMGRGIYNYDTFPVYWPTKESITLTASPGATGLVTIDGNSELKRAIILTTFESLSMSGITLQKFRVATGGPAGAIFLQTGSRLRINNMLFQLITSEGAFGAVICCPKPGYPSNATVEATNCIFRYNRSGSTGGVSNFCDWRVKNCYFLKNTANYPSNDEGYLGGGVFSECRVSAESSTFEGNYSNNEGGVIAGGDNPWNGVAFFANKCNFIGNRALKRGGVICAVNPIVLINCNFTANTAETVHGGVFIVERPAGAYQIYLMNSNFNNNTAFSNSGGVGFTVGGTTVATNCSFKANVASSGGVASAGFWKTNNCIFLNNRSIYIGADAHGGGVAGGNIGWYTESSTYENNSAYQKGGVFSNGTIVATNCSFSNNMANQGGVAACSGAPWLFNNCVFYNNSAAGDKGQGAVFRTPMCPDDTDVGSDMRLNNCVFAYNGASNTGGVFHGCYRVKANNCTFFNNSAQHGGVYYAYGMTNKNCIFWGNTCLQDHPVDGYDNNFTSTYSDIQVDAFKAGVGNISVEPDFRSTDLATINLRLEPFSLCIDVGTFEGAPTLDADGLSRPFPPTSNKYFDLGAYEVHRRDFDLYVDSLYGDDAIYDGSSIDKPLKTIKTALGYVWPGRTIWVKDGTYTENWINSWPTYWADNVRIKSRSGDRKKVLVNAGIDLSRVPGTMYGTIEGITVQNSFVGGITFPLGTNFLAKDCEIKINQGTSGGGVSNGRAINCTINGNTATIRGGGAYNTILSYCTVESNGAPAGAGGFGILADHCSFKSNTGNQGGGVCDSTVSDSTFTQNNGVSGAGGYHSTFEGCVFSKNAASNIGGGLYGGKALGCTFTQNTAGDSGGGMFSVEEARKCVFSNNSSLAGGGGIFTNKTTTVENCLFANNTGYNFYKDNASFPASIINCTFYGSKPIYVSAGDVEMLNSIVWNGTIETAPSSTLNATYSDIMGGLSGTGNINTNPSFVNPSASNYHLQQGSPCIDKATFEGAPVDDLEGRLRADPDMGAYEWASATLFMTAPHGGEIMEIGSNFNVTWNGLDQSALPVLFDNISIEVSTTEPAVWNNIDTVHLVETYNWPVPPVLSDHYKIALAVSGPGGVVTDRKESGSFSVVDTVPPVVTLESFPMYLGAGINIITWEATDLLPATDPVTIEVSTNEGTDWVILGEGQPMSGNITYETPSGLNIDYPHCIIRVKVIDLAGNYTSQQTMFGVDTKAPTMELTIATSVTSRTVPFTLYSYDEHGIGHTLIKSGDVSQWHDYPGTSELPATITLYPPTSGLHTVTFEVYDLGSNVTSETREIDLVLPATPEMSSVRINNMDPATVQYLPNKIKINCSIYDYQSDLASIEIKVRVGTTTYTYYATPEMSADDITYYTASREFTLPMTNGSPYIIIEAIDWAGNVSTYEAGTYTITTASSLVGSPRNVPNPFRPHHGEGTTIQYILTTDTTIKLMVYDITNRLIWQRVFSAGSQGGALNANNVFWDGRNDAGDYVPNGVYIYFITTGDKILGKGQMSVAD